MQEGGEPLHQTEDSDCENRPGSEYRPEKYPTPPSLAAQTNPHDHGPEDLGELGVGQGQGPQPEVGGRVGHSAEDKLDSVYSLEDHDLGEVCLLSGFFWGISLQQRLAK